VGGRVGAALIEAEVDVMQRSVALLQRDPGAQAQRAVRAVQLGPLRTGGIGKANDLESHACALLDRATMPLALEKVKTAPAAHCGGLAAPWQDNVVVLQAKPAKHSVAARGTGEALSPDCLARASSQLAHEGVAVMESSAAVPR
jgi:hypothetical protein